MRYLGVLLMATLTMSAAKLTKADWGKADGVAVSLFTLTNKNGMEVKITNYGGIITSIKVPDAKGVLGDVVLGFDSLDDYVTKNNNFGATIGRYGNRIGKAKFTLAGKEYKLAANNGENSLHGGIKGFNKVIWTPRELPDGRLELSYLSKDGEEGFPGNLKATVTFTLTDANALRIEYAATTDKETVVNLTNHTYFNLKGDGDILGHRIAINASRFTPVDAGLIPTGELRNVAGTPFDFHNPHAIGERINANDEQIKLGKGYDHNWVISRKSTVGLEGAAEVVEPTSGRVLEVWTTEPGVQFYTGNFLDGSIKGKGGKVYAQRAAFCLETQHFPDSPNKPAFPTTALKPGAQYKTTTEFRFSVKK